jgi:hypothetical protein
VIYVNVTATVDDQMMAQAIQGYIVVNDVQGGC